MKRLLSGIVLLPLLVALLLWGSQFLFACLVVALSILGLQEYYRMTLPGRPLAGLAATLAGALLVPVLAGQLAVPQLCVVTLLVLAGALVVLFDFGEMAQAARDVALLWGGLLYVPLLLSHLVLLRALPEGKAWLFLLMLIVMSGDTCAYYIGSQFGRHKLYPAVSPNKSIEGALGGLLGSLLGTVVAKLGFFPQLGWGDCLLTALLVGSLGQLGDLFESMLKRSCGVKDSGALIPGHGGILDRLDSILFAAPLLYYYAIFLFRP